MLLPWIFFSFSLFWLEAVWIVFIKWIKLILCSKKCSSMWEKRRKKCFTPPTPTKVHTLPSIKIIIYIYSSKLFEFFWSFTCVEKKSIQFLSLTHSINRYIIKKDFSFKTWLFSYGIVLVIRNTFWLKKQVK